MIKKNYSFKNSYNNNSFQNSKVIKYYFYAFFNKVFYFVLIILSVIIINISLANKSFNNFIINNVLFATKPLYIIAELPFNLLFDFTSSVKDLLMTNLNNKSLRQENLELKNLYLKNIDTKRENENLKELLNFKDNFKNKYKLITSKVYLNTKNGLGNILILNIGSNDGVKEGSLVAGVNKSIVGRVINVRENNSDVLLLNDINSRIPARTISTNERIILSGNNKELLEISYFNSKEPKIREDDLVYTSGDSNMIPDGFFIGTIKKINNSYYLKMNENINSIFNVIVVIPD